MNTLFTIITLSLCSVGFGLDLQSSSVGSETLFSSSVERKDQAKLFPQKGKTCGKITQNDYTLVKLTKKQNVWNCVAKCKNKSFCKGIAYNNDNRFCKLLKKPPKAIVKAKGKPNLYCGRKIGGGGPSPTPPSPTPPSPTPGKITPAQKDYSRNEFAACKPPERPSSVFSEKFTKEGYCWMKCDSIHNCRTYYYEVRTGLCKIFMYRCRVVVKTGETNPDRMTILAKIIK